MTFDTFTWDQPGCALIFGFTREQVWGAADAYLAKNPHTRGNTYDCILGYKKGFLQKYQTIVDLLTTQLPKKERPAFRAQLERHCKTVGLGEYIDRAPNSMGGEANRAWTCLSAALQGEKRFLISDLGTPESQARTARLAAWLLDYDPQISLLWLSAGTEDMLTQPIFPDSTTPLSRCAKMWHIENGTLTEVDAGAIRALRHARLKEEKARRDAELAAKLQSIAALEQQGQRQTALAQYTVLAEQGVAQAGTEAVRLCLENFRQDNSVSWLDKVVTLAEQSGSPKAYILLGDWQMNIVHENEDAIETDEDIRDLVVTALLAARKNYAKAAEYGDAEGCFRAAMLHLCYTFAKTDITENSYGEVLRDRSVSYDAEHAIPYIKKLLSLQDTDENTLKYVMLLQRADTNHYCSRARQEYLREN